MSPLAAVGASEWLKLRSVRSTWWFAAGALALVLLVAPLDADAAVRELQDPNGTIEAAASTLTAMGWAQFILGALGMLVMTSEYATRSIVVTLAGTPSRTRLLLAKAAVVGIAVFASGVVLAALGVAASAPLLGEHGDFDAVRLAEAIPSMGAYLALIAVLALGLGTLIRRSAGTLTVLVVLLLILPQLLQQLADLPHLSFLNTAADFTPSPAGNRFMNGEPEYALVLIAWAAVTLLAGAQAMRKRDA